jgi:hypothetical protein
MSYDETAPAPPPAPPSGPPPGPPAAPHPTGEPRARRTLGLPLVGAIAALALVLGGLVGGIIGYAVHSDGPDFRHGPGMWQPRPGGPGRQFRGPGNGFPQRPGGQAPSPTASPSPSAG